MIIPKTPSIESIAREVKEYALSQLKLLQGFKDAERNWRQAARAYRDLTGMSLDEAQGEFKERKVGRPPGSVIAPGPPLDQSPKTMKYQRGDSTKLIISYLSTVEKQVTAGDIITATGLSASKVSGTLKRLNHQGIIVKGDTFRRPGSRGRLFPWSLKRKAMAKTPAVKAAVKTATKTTIRAAPKKTPKKILAKGGAVTKILQYLGKHPESSAAQIVAVTNLSSVHACLDRMTKRSLIDRNNTDDGIKWTLLPAGLNHLNGVGGQA